MEFPIWCEEQCGGCLLIVQPRVSSFKKHDQTQATITTIYTTSLNRNSSP
jgi:hypothetical protein